MIRMGKDSRLSPSKVVEKAVQFFGPGGLGLEILDQDACCARFAGAGGHVYVQAADVANQDGSSVTVEGREWETQIKKFMQAI